MGLKIKRKAGISSSFLFRDRGSVSLPKGIFVRAVGSTDQSVVVFRLIDPAAVG